MFAIHVCTIPATKHTERAVAAIKLSKTNAHLYTVSARQRMPASLKGITKINKHHWGLLK